MASNWYMSSGRRFLHVEGIDETACMEKSGHSTAIHEAGHAVVGLVRHLDVVSMTIIPDEDYTGMTTVPNPMSAQVLRFGQGAGLADNDVVDEAFKWIEGRALCLLAGVTAQHIFSGEWQMDGAEDDMNELAEWVGNAYRPPEQHHGEPPPYEPPFLLDPDADVLAECWDRWGGECRDILKKNWAWVEAVAQAAMDGDGTLTRDQMKALRPEDD